VKFPRNEIASSTSVSTAGAEEQAVNKYRRRRRFLRTGQVLMLAGTVVGIVHWLTHIEAFGPEQPPLWLDLFAGYPMAALLLMSGGIVAGRK